MWEDLVILLKWMSLYLVTEIGTIIGGFGQINEIDESVFECD